LFGNVTLFPFVSVLKAVCKKPKGVRYRMQNLKNPWKYKCFACGCLIPSCSLQKGRWYPYGLLQKVTLWIPLHAESANCMQRRSCFAIYRTDKSNQNIKMETTFKIH
jgi:hypothetical protein